ncbi:hypothetical protein [Nonomuraea dietziae]|uniref:hypothetical protein n=1 Tax=Nonomuraea dietziae TaxID=65515 RepID=UPI0033F5E68E
MTLTAVVADLDWLVEYWPDLVEARLPMATPRPWRQQALSDRARDERDHQARIERDERSHLAIGESPAPVDVAILQTVLDVLVRADDLAAALAAPTLCPTLPPPGFGDLDARPYLAYAAARLHELGDEWADWAEPVVHRMYEQVARALSMVYDGQALDVICPWCRGVTPETPAGGATTWSVVTLPGDQVAIVCSGVCEPPQREVGTWWGGRPCWPMPDWERLAKRLRTNETRGTIGS